MDIQITTVLLGPRGWVGNGTKGSLCCSVYFCIVGKLHCDDNVLGHYFCTFDDNILNGATTETEVQVSDFRFSQQQT